MPKTLNFPVKPHVRKYLNGHLGHGTYTLSTADRFGKLLFHLLRRQSAGRLSHVGSRQNCTQVLLLDMQNFPVHQYGLTELTDYSIYHFNDFVDDTMREELYVWVRNFVNTQCTIKEVIVDFMGAYDLREEDVQYETLRKAVQRNCDLKGLKKKKPKSVVNMSRKSGELSRKSGELSRKSGGLSREAQHRAVHEELMKSPVQLTDLIRQRNGASV
ncbi:hypothetical protein CDA63_11845 [Hymenobacter amundsenii]|uniref:Uncharacterized protein n=1 Tax=Hymenobacter amundsenii TaxID=2006685 RepID=A0A246FJZ7_9BACT|nr:hypothetical protein [Hymenobacter amundsenii]OWP62904.1 hypothetical protein CDA63_11845 [Hymenobacter amundsenii]